MDVRPEWVLDNGTGEVLVADLRAGSKTANNAKGHIRLLGQALDQVPDTMRDEHGNLAAEKILVRTDSAGASRELQPHPHSLGLQFSTSFALPVINGRNIGRINNKQQWERVLDQHENERHDALVIYATQIIKLKDYPEGTRLYLLSQVLPWMSVVYVDAG